MEKQVKVGDKVRIVKGGIEEGHSNYHYFKKGQVVEVTVLHSNGSIRAKGITYELDGQEDRRDGSQHLNEGHYELIPSIDFTKPLETADGRVVTLVTTEGRGSQPVLGYIGTSTDVSSWNADGSFWSSGRGSNCNLRNVAPKPKELTQYINVFKRPDGTLFLSISRYDTAEAAVDGAGDAPNYVGRIKVNAVEGEFAE